MLTSTSGGDRMRYKEKRFFFPILAQKKDGTVRLFLRYLEIKFIENTD